MGESFVDGMLIGAAVGIAVVLVFAVIGFLRKPTFTEPPRRSRSLTSPLRPGDAFARIKGLAGAGRYTLHTKAADQGLVVLSDGWSLTSFGNFYPCFIRPAAQGSEISAGISPRVPQYGPVVSSRLNKITEAVRTAIQGPAS